MPNQMRASTVQLSRYLAIRRKGRDVVACDRTCNIGIPIGMDSLAGFCQGVPIPQTLPRFFSSCTPVLQVGGTPRFTHCFLQWTGACSQGGHPSQKQSQNSACTVRHFARLTLGSCGCAGSNAPPVAVLRKIKHLQVPSELTNCDTSPYIRNRGKRKAPDNASFVGGAAVMSDRPTIFPKLRNSQHNYGNLSKGAIVCLTTFRILPACLPVLAVLPSSTLRNEAQQDRL